MCGIPTASMMSFTVWWLRNGRRIVVPRSAGGEEVVQLGVGAHVDVAGHVGITSAEGERAVADDPLRVAGTCRPSCAGRAAATSRSRRRAASSMPATAAAPQAASGPGRRARQIVSAVRPSSGAGGRRVEVVAEVGADHDARLGAAPHAVEHVGEHGGARPPDEQRQHGDVTEHRR